MGPSYYELYPEIASIIRYDDQPVNIGLHVFSLKEVMNTDQNIKLILKPRIEMMERLEDHILKNALVIAITVLLISIPLAYVISIIPSRLQNKLRDSTEQLKKSAELLDKYVMTSEANTNGVIMDVSSAFLSITRYKKEEILGKNHSILKHPSTSFATHQNMWKTLIPGLVWRGEIRNLTKDGETFWGSLVITPRTSEGLIKSYTAYYVDITHQKEVEKISTVDPLTGAYNRNKITFEFNKEIERTKRSGNYFSIMILDIDHFKLVNDTYGHNIGDQVLLRFVQVLNKGQRRIDTLGRWGGEEFIIICPETDIKGIKALAEKLRKSLAKTKFATNKKVTASFGVAQYITGENMDQVIARADKALYQAKKKGRNKVMSG